MKILIIDVHGLLWNKVLAYHQACFLLYVDYAVA